MRTRALMEHVDSVESRGRTPIPDDVKAAVWNRDGGRCVRCGSNENIEFDHIIPFSKGGSSSFRNLQTLCEACNRAKNASIVG
jgi:5-methylcytosine-specific restriction endonuclease McrA